MSKSDLASHPERDRVFISYSHCARDQKHFKQLKLHLAYYERMRLVDYWDDTKIAPGRRWKEEIQSAIQRTKVAILLVSVDFLASSFIAEVELPSLLAASRNEGAQIFIVLLRPCAFEDTELYHYQAINPPDRPMEGLDSVQRDGYWATLARKIKDALAHQIGPIAEDVESVEIAQSTSSDTATIADLVDSTSNPYLKSLQEEAPSNASDIDPVDDLLSRAIALNRRRHFDAAKAILESAVELVPEKSQVLTELGKAYWGMGDSEDAVNSYRRAISIDEEDFEAWNGLAVALAHGGERNEALKALENALRLNPNNDVLVANRGVLLLALNQNSDALAAFEQAIKMKRSMSRYWRQKGVSLVRLERYSEALLAFDEARLRKPNDEITWQWRGYVLSLMTRNEEAVASYQHSIALRRRAETYERLADVLAELGRESEAAAARHSAAQLKTRG